MHFPLLEALLKKDNELCRSIIRQNTQTDADRLPLYKSMLTCASQHVRTSDPEKDGVVVTEHVIRYLQAHSAGMEQNRLNELLLHTIDYLCALPTEYADTSALKISKNDLPVISVAEVEEAFDGGNKDDVFRLVAGLMSLMDNKNYFMEIMHRIALTRSVRSIILTVATSRAIECMGWQNNFTPFLIQHMVFELYGDRIREHAAVVAGQHEMLFEKYLGLVSSYEDMIFLASVFRLYHEQGILSVRLRSQIISRLHLYFNSSRTTDDFTRMVPVDRISFQAAFDDMASVRGSDKLRSKIPFVV